MQERYKIATIWFDPSLGNGGESVIEFEGPAAVAEDRPTAVAGLVWALREVPEVREFSHARFIYAGALAEGVG